MPLCLILSVALVSLIAPSSTPVAAAGTGTTLEQVLSAPFPSDLVASPAGGAVAWVFDTRGARNVWIAEPPLAPVCAASLLTAAPERCLPPQTVAAGNQTSYL